MIAERALKKAHCKLHYHLSTWFFKLLYAFAEVAKAALFREWLESARNCATLAGQAPTTKKCTKRHTVTTPLSRLVRSSCFVSWWLLRLITLVQPSKICCGWDLQAGVRVGAPQPSDLAGDCVRVYFLSFQDFPVLHLTCAPVLVLLIGKPGKTGEK